MFKSIFEKWDEINKELESGVKSYILDYYLSKKSAVKTYLGIDNEQKTIYIEFTKEALSDFKCPAFKGMDISINDVPAINPDKRYIIIKNISQKDELFMAFSSSLCDGLLPTTTFFDAFQAILSTIKEYKDYFSNPNNNLGLLGEQGLCAELLELKELIIKKGETAVLNWQGPNKNKRDFTFDNSKKALEVKSTLSQTNTLITISNENQLDCNYPSTLEKLFLIVYILEQNDLGFDVLSCSKDVLDLITDVNIKNLLILDLLKLKVDLNIYKPQYKFSLQAKKIYEITSDFPKITKDSISSLISNVTYKISINSLTNFELPEGSIYE